MAYSAVYWKLSNRDEHDELIWKASSPLQNLNTLGPDYIGSVNSRGHFELPSAGSNENFWCQGLFTTSFSFGFRFW